MSLVSKSVVFQRILGRILDSTLLMLHSSNTSLLPIGFVVIEMLGAAHQLTMMSHFSTQRLSYVSRELFPLKNISKGIQVVLEMFTCLVAICKGVFNHVIICVYNIKFICRFMFVIGIVTYLCVFSRSISNLDSIPGSGNPIGLELGRYQVQLFD